MNHQHATPRAQRAHHSPTTDPRLAVLSEQPYNAETRTEQLVGLLTPTAAFYKRNHFPIPQLDAATWRLEVGGAVARPLTLTLDALRALPCRTLTVTLECAGNGRTAMRPPAEGEPWGFGAVSTAEWTGVPLVAVLRAAGVADGTREIVITGADSGHVAAANATIAYVRSMPVAPALDPSTLLAYAMNGEPLAPEHGYPLRLIVPGWYGMAAVKWISRLEASTDVFRGFYQYDRYVMCDPARPDAEPEPLTTMAVRSLICQPAAGATLAPGPVMVRGVAWSGAAAIARVEVSTDAGRTWAEVEFTGDAGPFAWRPWQWTWHAATPGAASLQSRAHDLAGNTQPTAATWNVLGYANNAVQTVAVTVAG
ncbi:MAG TPA: sulfite oxidase [Ktedonobacterales bacterium]|nr:sulfite oxidase [Ktedonobacterales bacterium]